MGSSRGPSEVNGLLLFKGNFDIVGRRIFQMLGIQRIGSKCRVVFTHLLSSSIQNLSYRGALALRRRCFRHNHSQLGHAAGPYLDFRYLNMGRRNHSHPSPATGSYNKTAFRYLTKQYDTTYMFLCDSFRETRGCSRPS